MRSSWERPSARGTDFSPLRRWRTRQRHNGGGGLLKMSPETPPLEAVAVIDIGSSGIRMVIAEIGPKLAIRYLENVQKPVPFGKDVFTSGRLSPGAFRQGIDFLNIYKTMLGNYSVRCF